MNHFLSWWYLYELGRSDIEIGLSYFEPILAFGGVNAPTMNTEVYVTILEFVND